MKHTLISRPEPTANVILDKVTKSFAGREILTALNIRFEAGQFVALLGRSGSGKTTILRLLLGLEAADRGKIHVPQSRTVVFQDARLVPNLSVISNVLLGLGSSVELRERARAVLAEVGLAAHENAWPETLSGGEAQRVALARALVRDPGLLLLDEPFAALDALTRVRMHQLVEGLWQRHKPTVLLVTHDVDEAVLLADRILVLGQDRKIIFDEPVTQSRPRDRNDPAFGVLRKRLLKELGLLLNPVEH